MQADLHEQKWLRPKATGRDLGSFLKPKGVQTEMRDWFASENHRAQPVLISPLLNCMYTKKMHFLNKDRTRAVRHKMNSHATPKPRASQAKCAADASAWKSTAHEINA